MTSRQFCCVLVLALAVGCASEDSKTTATTLAQAPEAVRTGIDKNFPGAKIQEFEKEVYKNGTVHYEVKLVGADGKKHEAEFAADGELLKSE